MDRKEFLATFGLGAVGLLCLGGCKSDENSIIDAPTNVDFTLDLTSPANAALNTNGGYVYNAGVVVARTTAGAFVAVSQRCTHQGTTVVFEAGNNRFHCPNHGSNFATNGSVINGPAERTLTTYRTELNGTSLRVFS